jgi:hypothetical protein
MGGDGLKNGKLLTAAEISSDVFVTADKSLRWQQHLEKYRIAVLLIRAKSNRLPDLLTCMPEVLHA